jgi:hypothetical protein
VKILFIGEGRHDIGGPSPHPRQPRPAGGTIPALARRLSAAVAPESVALAWSEISRFNLSAKKRGYPAKIAAAVLLATRNFNCEATITVADRDGKVERYDELLAGVNRASEIFPKHPIVWGLAVESVEAWTLAAPEAIADELGVDVQLVKRQYPAGASVEALSERSGKREHRPKQLLDRIAQLKHRHDSAEFREAVAVRTEVAALVRACPIGFAPFAEQVRRAFGGSPL